MDDLADAALADARTAPRHVRETMYYRDDEGWLAREFPSGRVERLAGPGEFDASRYPAGRPVPGPRPPFRSAEDLDWSDCPFVEVIPGKVSGQPLLVGTRLPVDALLVNAEGGLPVEEIAEQFEIAPDEVRSVLEVATKKGWRVAGPA